MVADLFIDIFDEVLSNLTQGKQQFNISNPSRLAPDQAAVDQMNKIREKIAKSVDDLLNTVIDKRDNRTVKDELGSMAQGAIDHLNEWLKTKQLSNDKLKAETLLIIEQARDIYERRKSELATAALERENKALLNIEKKIEIIDRLLRLYNELEPSALVSLISGYSSAQQLLPSTS